MNIKNLVADYTDTYIKVLGKKKILEAVSATNPIS